MCCRLTLLAILWLPGPSFSADAPADEDSSDIEFLKQHSVTSDVAGMLAYLKDRTLDEARIKRVRELIIETGHGRFAVRERAARELNKYGVSVLKFLEEARQDKDPEIAERARRLVEQIKGGPGASLPITVMRQLRRLVPAMREGSWLRPPQGNDPSAETVIVILRFLPFADDASVEDESLQTLARIAILAGKPDPAIRDFIKDASPNRRAAAGFVLGRSRTETDVDAARKLLADENPWVRLRSAQGLIAGERHDGIAALIKLIEPETDEVTWRAEDLLRRIAGEESPSAPTEARLANRANYVAAWDDWYSKKGKNADLAALLKEPPQLGLWLGIEYNTNCVWECGRDGKRRWTITAQGPMDAQILPGNRVLIAEQTGRKVTERDLKGNVLWEFVTTNEEALNTRRLPNGNTWIGTRHMIMEVRPNQSIVYSHRMSDQYMHAVRRLPNGNSIGITSNGTIREMTPAGKLIRSVALAHEGTWGDVDVLPSGNLLVANYGAGFVREVDQAGKLIREVRSSEATGVERQSNGQLLVGGSGAARMIDWTGRESWRVKSDGYVRRIHLR